MLINRELLSVFFSNYLINISANFSNTVLIYHIIGVYTITAMFIKLSALVNSFFQLVV